MIPENKDIRTTNSIREIVDCVFNKTYGEIPEMVISFFEALPNDQFHNYFRTLSVPYLFHKAEAIFKNEHEPIKQFIEALNQLLISTEQSVNNNHINYILSNSFENSGKEKFGEEVKQHTAQHYGNLFKEFDHQNYFQEAKNLLETRLNRNNIVFDNLKELTLLDQGGGGGRYTAAWKLLGIKHATCIDFSEIGLIDGRARMAIAKIEDVDFVAGSVLDMPFETEKFDIVYSNGVLHHTEDWRKGISEQLRVMKKGGWGWQYLIENPGGIFWDKIEILRAIMRNVNKKEAQNILSSLGIPMNRVFYMLDHVMVPINTRLTSEQIATELELNGAINIKRLVRGTDFDRVEAIYNKIPYAKEKFGVGENRFVFNKK